MSLFQLKLLLFPLCSSAQTHSFELGGFFFFWGLLSKKITVISDCYLLSGRNEFGVFVKAGWFSALGALEAPQTVQSSSLLLMKTKTLLEGLGSVSKLRMKGSALTLIPLLAVCEHTRGCSTTRVGSQSGVSTWRYDYSPQTLRAT